MKNSFFIVKYNDCYGNGEDTNFEILVKNKADFKKWLKLLNEERKANGEQKESAEEFTLIPIELF